VEGSAPVTEIERQNRSLLRQYFPGLTEKLEDAFRLNTQQPLSVETVVIRGTEVMRFCREGVAFFGEPPYHAGEKATGIINDSIPPEDVETDTIICVGSSFLTLIRDLLATRQGQIKSVIVLEPDPEVFIQVIKTNDLSGILVDDRLKILVSANPLDCADALAIQIHPMRSKGWTLVLNPDSYQFYRGFLDAFRGRLTSVTTTLRLVLNTTLRHSDRFLVNSFVNLANRPHAPDISIFSGLALNLPVLLIAAGPSLEKQLSLLAEYQSKCLMVCVGPAWKSLRSAGIVPHFVVSIDPFDPNYTHFEGLSAQSEWLISDLANNCLIVETFSGPVAFCVSSDDHGEIFQELTGRSWATIDTGGSVAHSAFNFCRLMGAKRIVLVGQDLAYTDGISHARGHTGRTFLADELRTNPDAFREIVAYGGVGQVVTNKQMDVYRLWYERLADKSDIVNATEGGARIDGVLEVALRDFFVGLSGDTDHERRFSNCIQQLKEISPTGVTIERLAIKASSSRRGLLSELRRVRARSLKCLKIMEELLAASDYGRALTPLKARYNTASRGLVGISRTVDLLLSALLKNEVFVSHRNFNLFSEDERKHFETNFSLHSRLVRATYTAEDLIKLFQQKKS